MDRNTKEALVAEYKEQLEAAETIVIAHYSGLSVDKMNALRSDVRARGANIKVSKNRLVRIALKDTKYEEMASLLTGPSLISWSSTDPVAPAKAILNFSKENDKLVIVGGAYLGKVMNADEVKVLGSIPSLDELRGKIIGILQAPGAQIARVVNAYATKE